MNEAFQAEITLLTSWIKTAHLVEERQVLWCLDRLPAAFQELKRTYESRFADDIARHQQAALARATQETGPAAGLFADKLRGKLQALNERFGLADLAPAPRLAPKIKRTRKPKNASSV